MPTIKDIATATNFSISTVSRVLNYDPTLAVTYQTKKKIFETAEKMNYTKHIEKKQKREEKQVTIAIIQWLDTFEEIDDIYYMSIRIGAEKRAADLGYNLIKTSSKENGIPDNIDGILAIGKFDQEEVNRIARLHNHVVFIGTNYPLENFDTINGDFAQAAEIALNHLIQQGHQRIGFIGAENKENLHGYRQYKSPAIYTFRDFMRYHGIFDESIFFFKDSAESNIEIGYDLMTEALKQKENGPFPTAFFVLNDAMVIGCLNALKEHQLSVPKDVSLISINDLSVSQYMTPALTTVKIYTEEMGEVGINTLKERMETENPIAKRIIISSKLIERESVKSIRSSDPIK